MNRITLIGNIGADPKIVPNGPPTLSLAIKVTWIDKQTTERRTRTEWHQLVWDGLGRWAATLPKGTPLFVEGELVYERYPRNVEASIGKETAEIEVITTVPKIKVQRLIRLESAANAPGEPEGAGEDL